MAETVQWVVLVETPEMVDLSFLGNNQTRKLRQQTLELPLVEAATVGMVEMVARVVLEAMVETEEKAAMEA